MWMLPTHPNSPGVDGCQVLLLCVIASLVQETILYMFMYRSSTFKAIKNTVQKQKRKLEELRAKDALTTARSTKEKRKKKEERLEATLKKDIMTSLGPQRMQASALVRVCF